MKFRKGENGYLVHFTYPQHDMLDVMCPYFENNIGLQKIYLTKLNKNGTAEGFYFVRYKSLEGLNQTHLKSLLARKINFKTIKPSDVVSLKWKGRQMDLLTYQEAQLKIINFVSNGFEDKEDYQYVDHE